MALTKIQHGLIAEGAGLTLATPQATTSGSTKDFTGIPAGVKQIIISFAGVSLSGGDAVYVQLGDAGGLETTGYDSAVAWSDGGGTGAFTSTTALLAFRRPSDSYTSNGHMLLTLVNASTNLWVASCPVAHSGGTVYSSVAGGSKTLSDVLTQLRVGVNGGGAFDAGSINISYS